MNKMGDLFTTLFPSMLFIPFIFTSAVSAGIVLPIPSGPYAVTHNSIKLTDEFRVDPLDPNYGKRQLMISSFYPVQPSACEQTCTIPYMSHNVATYAGTFFAPAGIPPGELEKTQFQVCCKTTGQENRDVSKVPLVLLFHGLSSTRLLHNALAQALASAGFVVVTMDHTFESVAVEFPDGSVVASLYNSTWDPTIPGRLDPIQDIRVDDVRFVLSQLASKDVAAQLVPGASSGFNTERVASLGQSFGGSTAIHLLMKDSRFVGGLDLDGGVFGEITDMQQPAVIVGATGVTPYPHNSSNVPSWAETLQHLKGWKAEIGLKNITHFGFTDVSFLCKTGALTLSQEAADAMIGTLDGGRSFQIISTYVTAFLDFVLKGKNTTLFDGPSKEFPEIVVL